MLRDSEFKSSPSPKLNFTFCNTPFIYQKRDDKMIEIHYKDEGKNTTAIKSNVIDIKESAAIFNREETIEKVVVFC